MQQLIQLTNFLAPYGTQSLFVIFGILLACGFGLPMPEDIILITGGILASRGICELYVTNLVCLAGVLIGDSIIFTLGYRLGPRIKRLWPFNRILTERNERRAKEFFDKYGTKIIFLARFMPGLRMPIFMSSGVLRVAPWKFFVLDGVAALISVPVWVHAGFVFGANLELLEHKIKRLQLGLYLVLGAIVVVTVASVYFKRRFIRRMEAKSEGA